MNFYFSYKIFRLQLFDAQQYQICRKIKQADKLSISLYWREVFRSAISLQNRTKKILKVPHQIESSICTQIVGGDF